ncbi:MAG: protoporphyrinogen oxidase, partial [Chloroflexi bacterium]|nr:protoporphyrinogen oxidase [Chloroflexota bacterium]
MKQVIIIGGGITGLAAAYRLQKLAPDVAITLLEREDRLGGKILTEQSDGFVVEGAPDSFLSRKPRGIGLCEELGLIPQLQGRDPRHSKTFVRRHGALYPLPSGLTGMIPTNLAALENNPLISSAGRARLAQEVDLPPVPPNGDETLAHFVTRRLGREVYENLVEPLMSGIYAGDGEQLSLAATFPQLRQLELKYGSLLKGLQASQSEGSEPSSAAPYPPFVAVQGGMGELVKRLVEQLGQTTLLTGVDVTGLSQATDGSYTVQLQQGQALKADAVIVTTPAFVTARLLTTVDPTLAELHAAIPYASSATISFAFAVADLPRKPDGYGYVIPRVEETDLLACTWSSSKWTNRAPADCALVRVYIGRFGRRDVLAESDAELVELALNELRITLGYTATPQRHWIFRWPQSMPQYLLGHADRLRQIEAKLSEHPNLFLAGAA